MSGCVPEMILSGRLITGFGGGLALVISPRWGRIWHRFCVIPVVSSYLAAVSPAQIRGSIVACSEVGFFRPHCWGSERRLTGKRCDARQISTMKSA